MIRIHYTNGDSMQGFVNVDVKTVTSIVAFVLTTDGNTLGTSRFKVPLKGGSRNLIEFEEY